MGRCGWAIGGGLAGVLGGGSCGFVLSFGSFLRMSAASISNENCTTQHKVRYKKTRRV